MEENQLSSPFIFVWVPILENDGNVCLDCLGDPLLEAIMYIMGLAHRYGKLSQARTQDSHCLVDPTCCSKLAGLVGTHR